jgi:hypothetical protein
MSLASGAALVGVLLFILAGSYNPVVFTVQIEALFFIFVMTADRARYGVPSVRPEVKLGYTTSPQFPRKARL